MRLATYELRILERLLSNRLNADFDPDIEGLLQKIIKEINDRDDQFDEVMKWYENNKKGGSGLWENRRKRKKETD